MGKNLKKMLIALCCTAFSALLAVGLAGCSKTLPQWIREQQCGEHEWNDGEVTKAATCTEEGETLYTCETCGATSTQVLAMLPHNEKEFEMVPSTCTAVGYTDGVQCVDCQAWIVGHEVIPMKEHDVVVQQAVEAGCLTKGMTEGSYCATCETVFEEQEEIAALGHQIVVKAGYAATCTVDGMTQGQECTRCGKVYLAQEVIEATGHSLQKVEGYAATCTSNGLTDGEKCVKCGKFTIPQEVIKATGHTIQKLEGYEPTCTSNGLTDGERCTTCGETLVAQTEIPALGHSAKLLPAVAATCTESGLTSGEECLRCGTTLKAQEVIAAKGHTIVTVEGYAATCTKAGMTDGQKCSTCEAVITAQTEIAALKHIDTNEDSVCDNCDFEYSVTLNYDEVDFGDGQIADTWYRVYDGIGNVPYGPHFLTSREDCITGTTGNGTKTLTFMLDNIQKSGLWRDTDLQYKAGDGLKIFRGDGYWDFCFVNGATFDTSELEAIGYPYSFTVEITEDLHWEADSTILQYVKRLAPPSV